MPTERALAFNQHLFDNPYFYENALDFCFQQRVVLEIDTIVGHDSIALDIIKKSQLTTYKKPLAESEKQFKIRQVVLNS